MNCKMKSTYYEKQSKSHIDNIRESHRKYYSKGNSPANANIKYKQSNSNIINKDKLNIPFFQATSPMEQSHSQNNSKNDIKKRYFGEQYSNNSFQSGQLYPQKNHVKSKNGKVGLGNSKLYAWDLHASTQEGSLIDRRKKKLSSNKAIDIRQDNSTSKDDSVFNSKNRSHGVTEGSKQRSEQTTQIKELDIQQVHYRLVMQQQKCKHIIKN